MMIMRDGRPTFYYDDKHEIRAGGLLLYRYDDGMEEPEFLMIKTRGKYEDFGGRTDPIDKSIDDTICREADEESNGILKMDEVRELINGHQPIYTSESKYLIYIVKTPTKYNPVDFGTMELHDGISRTVEWIKLSKLLDRKFINKSLHVRLMFKLFFEHIRTITNHYQL
jgi:hypothetical protein